MATKILLNTVNLPSGLVWAGTLIDDVGDAARFAALTSAGASFGLASVSQLATAASDARQVKLRGGDPAEADAIMNAAVDSLTVQATATATKLRRERYQLPTATGTDLSTATAKGDTQPKAPSAQANNLCNVQLATSGWTSSADVDVTLTGMDSKGQGAQVEVLTIVAAGTTVQSAKAWLGSPQITSWSAPAGWTAGTFKMQVGTKVGLPCEPGSTVAVVKECGWADETTAVSYAASGAPADATPGTLDSANGTYVPATAIDDGHSFDVWYTEQPATHTHALG